MFSIFREWWILRQLRKICRKGDMRFIAAREMNKFAFAPKETFLYGISQNFFIIIPRSKPLHDKRVARDRKILEKSVRRSPSLVKEESYYDIHKEQFESHSYFSDYKDKEVAKKELHVTTTGEGDNFTFLVALAEWLKTFWALVFVVPAAVIGSPYFLIIRDWAIKVTSPYSPLW